MCAAQVSVCPGGVPTGYTYFIPQEEMLESRVVTRGYMEARMVVALAGRCELRRPALSLAWCRALQVGRPLTARQFCNFRVCGERAESACSL